MAVGKIEYKKILDDEFLTPTKLKDLFISQLKDNSSIKNLNSWAINPEERYTIMSPEEASSLIKNRQITSNKNEEVVTKPKTGIENEVNTNASEHNPIQGSVWSNGEQQSSIQDEKQVNPESSSQQSVTKTIFNDDVDFVQQMTNAYASELQKRGLDPAFAEYLVAQDALESGWGKHQAGLNNFGGIKGKGSLKKSLEWDGEKNITVNSSFIDFNNLQDYISYKIDLVGNNRYNVFAYSPTEFFTRVKAGGYATDPNYVTKMNQVLRSVRKRFK